MCSSLSLLSVLDYFILQLHRSVNYFLDWFFPFELFIQINNLEKVRLELIFPGYSRRNLSCFLYFMVTQCLGESSFYLGGCRSIFNKSLPSILLEIVFLQYEKCLVNPFWFQSPCPFLVPDKQRWSLENFHLFPLFKSPLWEEDLYRQLYLEKPSASWRGVVWGFPALPFPELAFPGVACACFLWWAGDWTLVPVTFFPPFYHK